MEPLLKRLVTTSFSPQFPATTVQYLFTACLLSLLTTALQVDTKGACYGSEISHHQLMKVCLKHSFYDIIDTWQETKLQNVLHKDMEICNDLHYPIVDKEDYIWHKVEDRMVLVYSAFYERRKSANGPSIRIIAAGYQAAYNTIGNLYCLMWYPDRHLPVSVLAEYHIIYPSTLHPDMWCSHFIICKLPQQLIAGVPYAVTVSPSPCGSSHFVLKVLNRDEPIVGNTFAVCISPVYQQYRNWTTLIEMYEIHKLLGASEILSYNNAAHPDSVKVFDSYMSDAEEKVSILPWQVPYETAVKTNVHIQRGALNDCLYRLGHRHRFVTIQDLDEVLVPRRGTTWPQLFFDHDMYQPNAGIYIFQHYYFRRNESDVSPYFVTQNSFWRTEDVYPVGKIRCKSMYNAAKAVSVDLHYHYKMVPGATEYMVSPDEGALHHYRHQPLETFRRNPSGFTFVEDRYMETYKDKLHEAYDKRIRKIGFKN